jgi:hypothetical protein
MMQQILNLTETKAKKVRENGLTEEDQAVQLDSLVRVATTYAEEVPTLPQVALSEYFNNTNPNKVSF